MPDISNNDDIIDSRDVIERIAELEDIDDRDEDEAGDLAALLALAEEAEGYAEGWQYGEALIRDSHFEDYARELADDIGAISGDEAWPLTCIDWEAAAEALQQDYTSVDFDGVTYWIR
jgi:hypothetical protein